MSGATIGHWLVGFGRFWYDFIVGDSAALAIGGAAVLIVGALLVWVGAEAAAEVLMPVVVAVTLAWSVWPRREA